MKRPTIGRSALALLVAGAGLASTLAVGGPAARASTTGVGLSRLEPATWTDGQGRQYVLADQGLFGSPANTFQLFTMRDQANGDPDPT